MERCLVRYVLATLSLMLFYKVGENMTNEIHVTITEMKLNLRLCDNFELVSFDNSTVVLKWLHSNAEVLFACKPIPIQHNLNIITKNGTSFDVAFEFSQFMTNTPMSNEEQSALLDNISTFFNGQLRCALCDAKCDFEIVL